MPVKTTTGTAASSALGVHFLQQLEACHVRQAQVEYDTIKGPIARIVAQCFLAGRQRRNQLDVIVAEQFGDGLALDVVVLDNQQPLGARGGEALDAVESRRPRALRW